MEQLFYMLCILPVTALAMSNGITTETLLQDSSNEFTARMFTEVTKANPKTSVVLSAISVMTPLAVLALASVGASHDELLTAIGTPSDDIAKTVFPYANKELNATEGVTLNIASKIFIGKHYELNDNFVAVAKDVFDSEVQTIDFQENVKAATEINTWAEDKTNNRITNLVDPRGINGNTKAILVNAIYFKAAWADPFEKDLTEVKDFHVTENNVIQVPMMFRKAFFYYTESEELKSQIIEIPYNLYGSFLFVVLPREINGIAELLEKLKDPNILDNVWKKHDRSEVELKLPKFKIETTTNLKDVLIKMGVTKLFDPVEAKLKNLLKDDEGLFIDSAIQKTFLEVNEDGTEAGVVNEFAGPGGAFSFDPPPPIDFNANRPFYYAIKVNSLTLFNGVVYGA
ncbi:alaserpin-like [Bicyclus anynana]|uniref:Alaserpin-like n=1 Tax=Bicyclus anynana TaxID=110368 RepID=A0ABM3LH81_BICAN|nr:alaserpin-like [Bicyclus anynana]